MMLSAGTSTGLHHNDVTNHLFSSKDFSSVFFRFGHLFRSLSFCDSAKNLDGSLVIFGDS